MGTIREDACSLNAKNRYRRVVRSKSARSESLNIGSKQLAEDGEAGVTHPRALMLNLQRGWMDEH